MDRSRLEAFSDGVFAVAITLLVFGIVLPLHSQFDLAQQTLRLWPSFLAYLVSFAMIGIIWVNHHALVRSIIAVDRTLLFLNLILLMFVVLIPFATSTVATYRLENNWNAQFSLILYGGAFFGMSVGFSSIFEWTLHGRDRVLRKLPPEQHWPARIRFVSGGVVYLVAMAVALANALASFVIIALVAVYYIFERTPSPDGDGPQQELSAPIDSCNQATDWR
jgi:uncharacterized membrane protein